MASSNKLGAWGQSWISKAHGFHISGSGRLLSCLALNSLVSSQNSSMTTALRKFHEISWNNRHHLAPQKKRLHSKNCMHSSFRSNSDNLILGPIAWSIYHEFWLQIVIEALTDPSVHYKTLTTGAVNGSWLRCFEFSSFACRRKGTCFAQGLQCRTCVQ